MLIVGPTQFFSGCVIFLNFFCWEKSTSQKLCRSYYPHRSKDSLSPVCWMKKKITVYHRFTVFTGIFYRFSSFFTLFHSFSLVFKNFTVYHRFFTLKKQQSSIVFFTIFNIFFSLTIFNRFPPFCIGTTICKRREIQCLPYAGFFWQDFSFGDISLLVTFQFWQHFSFLLWLVAHTLVAWWFWHP